jgi:hypothetical protein
MPRLRESVHGKRKIKPADARARLSEIKRKTAISVEKFKEEFGQKNMMRLFQALEKPARIC